MLFADNSAKGAWAEILVCADLLARGFEVFRAISPSASCDLIVIARGTPTALRVEVKCSNFRGPRVDGQVFWNVFTLREQSFDVLAAVMPSGAIHYDPPLGTAPTIEWVGKNAFREVPLAE